MWQTCVLSESWINRHWLIFKACGLSCPQEKSVIFWDILHPKFEIYIHTHEGKGSCWESHHFFYLSRWWTRYLGHIQLIFFPHMPQTACGRQAQHCSDTRVHRDPAAPTTVGFGQLHRTLAMLENLRKINFSEAASIKLSRAVISPSVIYIRQLCPYLLFWHTRCAHHYLGDRTSLSSRGLWILEWPGWKGL